MTTLTRFLGKPLFPRNARSQATNSADVRGSTTDPSGAVAPRVTVAARDLSKDTGPLVPNDAYLPNFKKESSATIQREPSMLSAGLIGMNLQLNVGKSTTCPNIAKD
jgi:hypothetical protein